MRRSRLLMVLMLGLAAPAPSGAAAGTETDALARTVERAESARAIKTLQRLYAQYAQFGLWRETAALFAPDARFTFDGQIKPGETATGQPAIAAFLRKRYGDGRDGLAPGAVHTLLIEAPLVSLSADGETAKGRWYLLALLGGKAGASIEGGTFENDYVRQRGVWKIAAAHYYPQYVGPYESGWLNWGGGDLPIVPYHFTPETAGVPIPPPPGPARRAARRCPGSRRASIGSTPRIRCATCRAPMAIMPTEKCGTTSPTCSRATA